MKLHNVAPGSAEWLALRARCRCASEAPAVMNASRHLSRQDLVRMKALGLEKEFSEYAKKLLERGHEIEAAAREIVEERIGAALYPAVVTDDEELYLSSLDGMPMVEDSVFECKSTNTDLRAMLQRGVVDDPHYYWQLEHQLMTVPQAEKSLFTISDGTPEGTKVIEYTRVPGRREELLRAWDQIDEDVVNYVHVDEPAKAVGQKVQATLPALVVELSGQVIDSNLAQFREAALHIIGSVNTNLQDDQDFADAKEGVKFCETVEERVKLVKEQALGKMVTVEEAFRALDDVADAARKKRLELEALVKARDVSLKAEIVQNGKDAFAAHIAALNTRLGKPYMPVIATDFPACIRNKRSFKNMRDARDAELARAKIEANRIADAIALNLNYLREHAKDHAFLFADTAQLVLKEPEFVVMAVKNRIGEHRAEEQRRAEATAEKERERIRAEEQAKAEREARAKLEAEQADAARLQREQAAAQRAQEELEQQYAVRRAPSAPAQSPAAAPITAPALSTKPAAANSSVVPINRGKPSLRLGQINERIAPLKLDAAGLDALGFKPAGKEGAAVLFFEADFGAMVDSMVASLRTAQERRREPEAV